MIYNCGHFAQAFSVLAVAAFSLSATPAISQETGRQEYMNYCSSCHGDTAKGDGEVAQFLSVNTPSLTSLSEQNDGEFPLLEVIQIIDGRSGLGPHGTLMPVWGDRYKEESIRTSGEYGAEVIVRGRILSLATYLQSIQE
ncbi:cytochrome c [Octadecabacter sp. SW4]|nr:cytochrome c [Octadecabacter sp. SW4]